jgi:ankyrin repeat protein
MSLSDSMDDWYEREQLHFSAQDGDVAEVNRLLEAGYQTNVFDELGKTPLHYAAERGHFQVIEVLIASGADVNAHDESVIGNIPLRDVAADCSYEVAKMLIDAGADLTITIWMMFTALHKAYERTEPEGLRVRQLLEQATHVSARLGHNNSLSRSANSGAFMREACSYWR